jgi:hypothetical protein
VGFHEEGMYDSDVEVGFANHTFEKECIDLEEDNEYEELVVDEVEGDVHDEPRINDVVQCESNFVFDPENLKIEVNILFLDVNTFRKLLRYFTIKNEFEVLALLYSKITRLSWDACIGKVCCLLGYRKRIRKSS